MGGQAALVTGSSRGIGLAAAVELARAGFALAVNGPAEDAELAAAVDESALGRYERTMKNRGDNVVVGIEHGVCGGCHMRIPPQIIMQCRGEQELTTCTNCGRILYYTRDMILTVAD